uniref:Glutathione-disulfide reductase n=1 Tax=Rhizochromulina marina TaxID=1034831 RepID=A0A7S2RMG4_9STRA|mmetsp:Transcript_18370/g.53681  ORF Transcript_18370/g.53681 Transcript_18370/m.53681 type:complete len:536 (+) Transcript_18370:146-1753(+)
MAESFDFIVIGGGSAGSACARRAAGYGAKVVLLERGVSRDADGTRRGAGVGGTCVNVGCVPKKLMFNAAQQREFIHGPSSLARSYEVNIPEGAGAVDWPALKAKRDAAVKSLNGAYDRNWKKAGIEVVMGLGAFVDSKTIKVTQPGGKERAFTAPHILIACGGEPNLPRIPGAKLAITSDGFFDLEEQPKKAAVVGAGYIGVEMAGILHALGTETHLVFRGDTVLRRGFDPYIVETLMGELEKHGPTLHSSSNPTKIERAADGTLTLDMENGKSLAGLDCILMAIGRRPVTDLLQLDRAGVTSNNKGLITVDEFENTTTPGIYALGDCTDTGYELTPVAIAAGRRLADRVFGGEPRARLAYEQIATVVFSHPPIGTVGLTEPQAVEQYGKEQVQVKQSRFSSMLYQFAEPDAKVKTALKLVLVGPEERVVGLHMIGPFSEEMLQGFAVAVRMGATRADLEASVAIHPTIAEELVTFGGWGQKKQSDGALMPMLPPYLHPHGASTQHTWLQGLAVGVAVGAAAATAVLTISSRSKM